MLVHMHQPRLDGSAPEGLSATAARLLSACGAGPLGEATDAERQYFLSSRPAAARPSPKVEVFVEPRRTGFRTKVVLKNTGLLVR